VRLSDIDFHDEPVPPDGYRRLRTRAWWAGFHGLGPEAGGPYTVLVEQVLTEWVPTDPARDWLWDRRFTGEQRWLAGSAERGACPRVRGGCGAAVADRAMAGAVRGLLRRGRGAGSQCAARRLAAPGRRVPGRPSEGSRAAEMIISPATGASSVNGRSPTGPCPSTDSRTFWVLRRSRVDSGLWTPDEGQSTTVNPPEGSRVVSQVHGLRSSLSDAHRMSRSAESPPSEV
jgi:hypothetical protein